MSEFEEKNVVGRERERERERIINIKYVQQIY